jgi:hypothetical protein
VVLLRAQSIARGHPAAPAAVRNVFSVITWADSRPDLVKEVAAFRKTRKGIDALYQLALEAAHRASPGVCLRTVAKREHAERAANVLYEILFERYWIRESGAEERSWHIQGGNVDERTYFVLHTKTVLDTLYRKEAARVAADGGTVR